MFSVHELNSYAPSRFSLVGFWASPASGHKLAGIPDASVLVCLDRLPQALLEPRLCL